LEIVVAGKETTRIHGAVLAALRRWCMLVVHNESSMPLSPQRFLPVKLEARLLASCTAIAFLLFATSGCISGARPNFSGSWELDTAHSDFGPEPGPSKSTQVIEHQEPVLRLTADSEGFMGENHLDCKFVTDGSEQTQTVEGKPRRTRTYWEGSVLVTEWKVDNPGPPGLEMVERRSLSADGQTMTVQRQVHSSWADWEQKAVFVRRSSEQNAPAASGGS
jgi:hypothetical protein